MNFELYKDATFTVTLTQDEMLTILGTLSERATSHNIAHEYALTRDEIMHHAEQYCLCRKIMSIIYNAYKEQVVEA